MASRRLGLQRAYLPSSDDFGRSVFLLTERPPILKQTEAQHLLYPNISTTKVTTNRYESAHPLTERLSAGQLGPARKARSTRGAPRETLGS